MASLSLGSCLLRCARARPSSPLALAAASSLRTCSRASSSTRLLSSLPPRRIWSGPSSSSSRRCFAALPPHPTPAAGDRSPPPPPGLAQDQARLRMAHAKAMQDRYYKQNKGKAATIGLYMTAVVLVMVGASYAAVPLYRAFCGATGFAGIPMTEKSRMDPAKLVPTSSERRITVHFNASTSDILPWEFKPAQTTVTVRPGETALAFYTAKNYGDEDIVGISTYNVVPGIIAPYFAKVECFCFEEQRILAGEEIDLPVFFFLDRDLLDDPQMDTIDDVVLNYTFFKARRNQQGHAIPDAAKSVVDKASGWDEYEDAPLVGERDAGAAPSAVPKPAAATA